MKKIKILITGIVMIGTVLVAGLAHAADTNVTITFDVESVTGITACTSIDLGLFSINQGKDNSVSPCNVIAYSNDPDGFTVALHGTNDGFRHSSDTSEWLKLNISTGNMDTSCTSGCTEAWGFRIATGTASEYDTVEADTNNGPSGFDATNCGGGTDKCWHTVNYDSVGLPGYVGAETIITNSGPTTDDTANFDLEIGAITDNMLVGGDYDDILTLIITTL